MTREAQKLITKAKAENWKRLDLGRCGLTDLEKQVPELFELTDLEELVLSNWWIERNVEKQKWEEKKSTNNGKYNLINQLPKALSNLKKLRVLVYGGSTERWGIRDISSLSGLSSLTTLYLQDNQLTDITPLSRLSSLTTLYLQNNQLTDIAPLSRLSSLTILYLDRNQLTDISPLSGLSALTELYLQHNQLTDIAPLSRLSSLTILYLDGNQLTDISPLSGLSALTELYLQHNQLTDITPLSRLSSLKELDLRNNQLTNVSSLISLLRNNKAVMQLVAKEFYILGGNEINVKDNPLKTPPMEVIEQGREAVLRYFEQLDEETIEYLYEAKLTLVGEGGAGKTSLQKRLLKKNAALPKTEERTRGIAVEQWRFKRKRNSFVVHVWDFGGQDVYYPVHRFFLTEQCVFVLVASTRTAEGHNFAYWIPTIYQFGGDSAIVLVQNCFDGNRQSWADIKTLLEYHDFNIVRTKTPAFYSINLPNGNEGLEELKEVLEHQISHLDHIGKPIFASWKKVRETIANILHEKPCMSYHAFSEFCRKIAPNGFEQDIDVATFTRYMHQLGILLWYHNYDELKDWVILSPKWAMDAVYTLIDDSATQNGIIAAADLRRLWSATCYEGSREVLRHLLARFKIAFPKKRPQGDYIIPTRLELMPNNMEWKTDQACLAIEYHFDFMPKALVNQLSADLSSFILHDEQDVWVNAVNFTMTAPLGEASAQVVEEALVKKRISIKTRGNDARALLLRIMEGLNDILKDYRGVKPAIKVVCRCHKCSNSSRPIMWDYIEELLSWRKDGDSVRCNASREDFLIDNLLYQAALPIPWRESENMLKPSSDKKKVGTKIVSLNLNSPSIFISYAKEDLEHLQTLKKHLSPLLRNNDIQELWHDREILAGADWDDEIQYKLNNADVVFILVSADYFSTKKNYIWQNEMPRIIKRHKNKEALVIPIIVRDCLWEEDKWLSQLQAVTAIGKENKGIPLLSADNQDEAFANAARQIQKAIEGFR
ncbi:MAG: leucine-rich repeat domain-containing protein [Chitinophagales bacterium]|nr:leucine-rich repeat domain-containing protein [Chitinophagales bacterium]